MSPEMETSLELLRQCVQRLQLTGGMLNKDLARDITKFISLAGQADTGTSPSDEVGNGPNRIPGVRGVEGEGTSSEVPAGDGKPSDAAEQRREPGEARAAELEAIYPNTAIYRRSE